MALQAELIPFSLRTGTGTQTINHVRHPSVQAKAIIFICATSSGINSPQTYGKGFDDGTNRVANALATSDDPFNSAGIVSARGYTTAYSLLTEQSQVFFGGAARILAGYVSAINVGSFDITLDLNNTPGANWFAVMIGGDDVSCAVGVYNAGLGPGTITVGFNPVAILKLSTIASGTGEVSGAYHSYGFATPCDTAQVGWGIARSFGNASSFQLSGNIQADIVSTSTVISDAVTVTSYPANGFATDIATTADFSLGYLAIGGSAVSANLVAITQPTTTGVQTTTITATDPVIAFFASTNKTAQAGAGRADANLTFGVYDGTDNMCQWWGNVNTAARVQHRRSSTSKSVVMATATGDGTSTVNAEASCTLASTQIALNWTSVDSTQRQLWALVLADNLTGGTNNCGANPQASITVIKQCTPIPGGTTDFPFGSPSLTPTTFTLQDGGSQLFSSVTPGTYSIVESAPSGWTASYTSSNGSPNTALTVASAEAVTLTVTNTFQSSPTAQILRRVRRFALPWQGNKKIFIPRIEIIAQMGVGNADDPAPVMSIRISPDGGETWGDYREMPLGAAGDTMIRAYLTRFCQGLRNPVAELICDAPVQVAWVACELPQDFTVGTS